MYYLKIQIIQNSNNVFGILGLEFFLEFIFYVKADKGDSTF